MASAAADPGAGAGLHLALYQPEIPPNTGNIIRLCANTGTRLHLIGPLGFALDDRRLRRAGLDYDEYARVVVHASHPRFLAALPPHARVLPVSTRGATRYDQWRFVADDVLLLGPETRGLPAAIIESAGEHSLRLPMRRGSRSLNLANAAAVVVYEAWRQLGFAGAAGSTC